MWELDHKEGWVLKYCCFWIVVLVKTLESLLDSRKIKPVTLKGNQPWMFIGSTDAKADAPILCPPNAKSQLLGKDPDVGKDWRQEEKGATEDKMVGWHYRLNGHEFEQTPGDGEGQGSLKCCSPWDCKKSEQRTTVRGPALSGLPQPSVSCDVTSCLPASYKYGYEWSQVLSSEASVKPHKHSLKFLLPLQICGNRGLKKRKKLLQITH